MALKKITRTDIEKMHRQGEFKNLGTVHLKSGEKLSGTKFRDYLFEKAKKYGTVTSLTKAIQEETAPSQWRQRQKIAKTFQPKTMTTAAQSGTTKLQRRQDIFGKMFGKPEKKKPLPFYRRATAGSWNPKTGRYEDTDINRRPGMAGSSRSQNASIGLGSTQEQAKRAQTSALDGASSALGIGQQSGGGGFKTIGNIINKK
jgi:hypothetical protein